MCDYLDETVELSENGGVMNEDVTASECPEADKDDLLEYYKDFLMNGCLLRFSEYMGVGLDGNLIDNRPLNDLPYLDYSNINLENNDEGINNDEEIDHSREETDDYYFCKYGIAYAFEYAMFYDIMLRIHNEDRFGVYSFGCGGFVDAWSLAYARANLQAQGIRQNLELFYQGIDIVRWPTAVFGELVDNQWPADILDESVDEMNNWKLGNFHISYRDIELKISRFTFRKPQWNGIQQFRPRSDSNSTKMYYNVLMFSKLLNLLSSGALNEFIERLKGFEYDQPRKQRDYYICVSHSPTRLREGAAAVERIVQMFIDKGFRCEDDMQVLIGDEEQYNNLCETYRIENKHDTSISAYVYYRVGGKKTEDGRKKPPVFIKDHLDRKFECSVVQRFLKNLSTNLCNEGKACRCIQMGTADIAFQIIKLTKSE